MAVTSNRSHTTVFTGDFVDTDLRVAATNVASPGTVQVVSLVNGNNSFSTPGGGTIATACAIIPPLGNTVSMSIKGLNSDSGIRIHNTDPMVLSLDPSSLAFIITTTGIIVGLRLIWS